MYLTTRGLVLREVNYKEADKILTVLTADHGKLTVKARGALRKSSRIAGASQLLAWSEMTLFENRGYYTLQEAALLEQFDGLRTDLEGLALGSYFAELLEAVSDEDSPENELLRLGLNSLYALARGLYSPAHIKSVFELRLMCLAGFAPELSGCCVCGGQDFDRMVFGLNSGMLRCRSCPGEGPGISLPVCRDTVLAMRHIAEEDIGRCFAFSLGESQSRMLHELTEAYVTTQLERGFGALNYWKTIRTIGDEHGSG